MWQLLCVYYTCSCSGKKIKNHPSTNLLDVSRMDHVFPVTVPVPLSLCTPLFFLSILLLEVGVMWSLGCRIGATRTDETVSKRPLSPTCQPLIEMDGSTLQAPHEEIADEGVVGMTGSLIPNSLWHHSLTSWHLAPEPARPLWRADDT